MLTYRLINPLTTDQLEIPMTDITEDELKTKMDGEDSEAPEVDVIADPDKEQEGKSIAELVSAALLKRGGRRSTRKKPVVVLLKDDAKEVPETLLALKNDKEHETVVLTSESRVKRPAETSLEEYLDGKKIRHTSDIDSFLDILYEE